MKKIRFHLFNVSLLLFTGLIISCNKEEKPPTFGKTIADIVNSDANFSLLKIAIEKAGLGAALSADSYTVFAPDNAAFAASQITEAAINSMPTEKLAQLLTYHVIKGKFVSTSIPNNATVQTLSGINFKTTKNENGIFINNYITNHKVTTPDLIATNGVIHVIEKVLIPPTITDIVVADPNFSLLKTAVTKAGLAGELSGGALTVFAPDNDAFAASGIDEAAINLLSSSGIDSILKYHVVGTKVPSTAVPASDTVNTLLTTNLYASKNTNGVFMNGIAVKVADVQAANGVIHVVSKVLIPPTKTIAQIVSEDPELSLLLKAVERAGLVDVVSGPGKYTVFAPIGYAFLAEGLNETAINAKAPSEVADIVSGHILPMNVFSSDITNGATTPTLQPNVSLVIGLSPLSVKIVGSSNSASNIISLGVDIIATNGVIHKISKVLLP